ncbi:MAG: serine/threonine protein kinase [Planctomycetota bacterium]
MPSTRTLDIPGYQVVRYLGSGARSSIWSIRQRNTGEIFALKRVVRREEADDRFLQQAENEFAIASRISHPVIRRCHEIRRIRKWFKTREVHLIMEYCPGKSVQEDRPTDLMDVLRIFTAVAEGLNHMHRNGWLHADMKPNNIIVASGGTVKVIDLGQGCEVGTIKDRIQGTPDFIAPEQVNRYPLDPRTDVFNFGAALYWTLTGQAIKTVMPKQADTIHLKDELNLQSASELNPEVPPALAALVADCVAFQASKRPVSMEPVLTKLALIHKQLTRQIPEGNAPGDEDALADEGTIPEWNPDDEQDLDLWED